MVIRVIRFLLVAGVATAAVVYGTPMTLLSTPVVTPQVLDVSAKDLQVSCAGPTFVPGGKNQTSVSSFNRSGTASSSLTYSGKTDTSLKGYSAKAVTGFGVRQDLTKRIAGESSYVVLDETGKTPQGSELLSANQIPVSYTHLTLPTKRIV